jgi:predicted permease
VIGTATHGFLGVLGVGPALGRFFTPEEDTPSGPPVAVLSYGAWMRRFGGSPAVLGKTITLDGAVRTIVGVMPKDLVLPGTFTCEAWLPAAYDIAANMRPGYDTRSDGDHVIGRLRTGVSAERATAELRTITHLLDEVLERRSAGMWDVRAVPLGSDLAESGRTALRLVALVVALALLLVCVNLAGLLLARSTSRSHEMAVRASLGAGRARLFRYAVTESLLLALAGGTIGLAIARWGVGAIATAAPPRMGLDSALRIDGTVIGFAFGLSLLTGVVFGLVPAARGSKADLALVLKGTPGAGRPARSGRLLSVLVVGEVALALLLLVGGGLTTRSLLHLMRVDTGVRADRVLTFRISLAGPRYGVEPRRLEFFTALLERVWRMPGVVSTAAVSPLPMSGEYSGSSFAIEGRPAPGNPRDMMSQFCQATPGYFRTMRVPVVRGREFEDGDGAASPVVVVNEELARRYFAGEDPVGHRLARLGTIIGVVGNIRHNGQASGPDPQIYYPVVAKPGRTLSVVVRTSGEPMDIAALVRDAVRALDGDIPVERLKPMEDVEAEAIATPRIVAGLVGGFAVFALVLAGIGLYGVMAYLVNQRQHEIGVRMALGASRRTVVAMIVARGTRLAAAGLVIGMPAALGTVRLASSLLYGLNPYDLVVFASVPLVLLAVALLASYLPARYAASLDPLTALRTE